MADRHPSMKCHIEVYGTAGEIHAGSFENVFSLDKWHKLFGSYETEEWDRNGEIVPIYEAFRK